MSEKYAITRAGQRLRIIHIGNRLVGKLAGYPTALKAGWNGSTWWHLNGEHCLCRCDDLIDIRDKPIFSQDGI